MRKRSVISIANSWRHNKKQYDLYASNYDAKRLVPSFAFWNNYLDIPAATKLIGHNLRRKPVLDLGCGSGLFTRKLMAMGADVFGLDFSPSMIDIASSRVPKSRLLVGDSNMLPLAPGKFAIVVSNLLIHYFKDARPTFKEVNRVLKAGGEFIFTFHHPMAEIADYKYKNGKVTARLNPYYHNDLYRWRMAGKMELISYHHTFENIFSSLKNSGFVVADLIEPRPAKRSKAVNLEAFEITSRFPNFCAIKAVKL